jgi:hypothetical protein
LTNKAAEETPASQQNKVSQEANLSETLLVKTRNDFDDDFDDQPLFPVPQPQFQESVPGPGNGLCSQFGQQANVGILPPQCFLSPQQWYQDFEQRFSQIIAGMNQQTFDRIGENRRIWALQVINNIRTRLQIIQLPNVPCRINPFCFQGYMIVTENMLSNLGRNIYPLTWKTAKCGLQQNASYGGVDCGQL